MKVCRATKPDFEVLNFGVRSNAIAASLWCTELKRKKKVSKLNLKVAVLEQIYSEIVNDNCPFLICQQENLFRYLAMCC